MAQDPLRIAWWRFEQISFLLDPNLTPSERRRLADAMARTPLVRPSGREAPIPVSTRYRWWKLYRRDPRIESLMPRPRSGGKRPAIIEQAWLQYALALLEEEPARSLYVLTVMIRNHFGLPRLLPRASLHRALVRQPRYHKVRKRRRGEGRSRRRFQARHPHEIWQGDAKAKFRVRLTDGTDTQVRVLSLLDDATRFVLAALIVLEETAAAAIATFRRAAARFGLPEAFYADRGSAYDSDAFRKGLAVLGVRRIPTKAGNPSAHGKIEAYHRPLHRWFVKELRHQPVRDLAHLQELLDAVLDQLYHEHPHKELKKSPRDAMQGRLSSRLVTLERLREAFLMQKTLLHHPKDRTIRVAGRLFRVPGRRLFPKRRVPIVIDPEEPHVPYLVVKRGVLEPLLLAVREAGTSGSKSSPAKEDEPVGSLTPLLERYRGRTLPLAHAGFGLPEIYTAFSSALGRDIPRTEAEATAVLDWLARRGPFEAKAFHAALSKTLTNLGSGRPLAQILRRLDLIISRSKRKENP